MNTYTNRQQFMAQNLVDYFKNGKKPETDNVQVKPGATAMNEAFRAAFDTAAPEEFLKELGPELRQKFIAAGKYIFYKGAEYGVGELSNIIREDLNKMERGSNAPT